MTDCRPSVKSDKRSQSSSNVETFTFRVEPSSVPVFITKLCLMLEDATLRQMISWSNDGKRFCVFDIPGFSKVVLPQYFKHNNWPSFVRQLNMYGFHKVNDNFSARHGQLICEFHHPLFYRNGRLALRKIRRNSRKTVSNTWDSQTQHQSHHSSLQQKQHIQRHDSRYQKQLSPSHQSNTSSSMQVSSLLSSNDNDSADSNSATCLGSPTKNGIFGSDTNDNCNISNSYLIEGRNRTTTGSNIRNSIDSSNRTFDMDDENNSDTSTNIGNAFGHGDYFINKHTTDVGYDDDSESDKSNSTNSMAPLAQQYTEIRRQLDQLQSNTTTLNSEMLFLKRYVAKQQESVIDLLTYLSAIVGRSDQPGFKNYQHHQEALKALQTRCEQDVLDTERDASENIDGDKDHYHHHDYPYYYHDHHHNHTNNNEKFDTNHLDSNNQTKKETANTIHVSKQRTESAKKDHHMHIHPLDNKEGADLHLLLDNNKNDTHRNNQDSSNTNYSNDNESTTTTVA